MLHDEARKLIIEAWNNTQCERNAVLHGGNVCVESSSEKGW